LIFTRAGVAATDRPGAVVGVADALTGRAPKSAAAALAGGALSWVAAGAGAASAASAVCAGLEAGALGGLVRERGAGVLAPHAVHSTPTSHELQRIASTSPESARAGELAKERSAKHAMLWSSRMWIRFASLLGIIPPFLMLWYAESFERRVKEPVADWRYRVLVAAALISVPISWGVHVLSNLAGLASEPYASLLEAFVGSAALEEWGKVLCLYLTTRLHLGPRTRYGAFLYGLHAAAGFALVENVGILTMAPNVETLTVRFVLRAYMASPMHLFAGGVIGFLWARRRFDRGAVGLSGGLAIALLIHGFYNACLFGVERLPETHAGLIVACAVAAIAVPLAGVVILRWLAGRLRDDDARDGR
jgi:RsiW-degrading membrane proteinase PrsW (M82 family)